MFDNNTSVKCYIKKTLQTNCSSNCKKMENTCDIVGDMKCFEFIVGICLNQIMDMNKSNFPS